MTAVAEPTTAPALERHDRLAELDGPRGIANLAVFAAHVFVGVHRSDR